jgi:uncharacterized CHY-type Zn-finger protein
MNEETMYRVALPLTCCDDQRLEVVRVLEIVDSFDVIVDADGHVFRTSDGGLGDAVGTKDPVLRCAGCNKEFALTEVCAAFPDHAAERYVLGEMDPEELERFEAHYFECRICLVDVHDDAVIGEVVRAGVGMVSEPKAFICDGCRTFGPNCKTHGRPS